MHQLRITGGDITDLIAHSKVKFIGHAEITQTVDSKGITYILGTENQRIMADFGEVKVVDEDPELTEYAMFTMRSLGKALANERLFLARANFQYSGEREVYEALRANPRDSQKTISETIGFGDIYESIE